MSQSNMNVGNVSAPSFRSAMNDALQALASTSSGGTAPSTTYANQLWYDTTANILKMRNEANSAWINLLYIEQTGAVRVLDDTQVVNTSGTQTGLLGDQTTATWEAGTGTVESLVSPAKIKAAIDALAGTLGRGQTWQDVSASRAVNTSYQNTTGRPIMVSVGGYGPTAGAGQAIFQVSADNVTWVNVAWNSDAAVQTLSTVVPDSWYYRTQNLTALSGGGGWSELR